MIEMFYTPEYREAAIERLSFLAYPFDVAAQSVVAELEMTRHAARQVLRQNADGWRDILARLRRIDARVTNMAQRVYLERAGSAFSVSVLNAKDALFRRTRAVVAGHQHEYIDLGDGTMRHRSLRLYE